MITLTGNPLSTQHIYLQHGNVRFMRQEAKDRKEQYQWEAKSQWRKMPMTGDIKATITLCFGDRRRRDFDNFHKLSCDALSGICYIDDNQIREATIKLAYDKENPRIEIDLTEIS